VRTCSVVTDPVSLQLHDHVAWCGRGPEALQPLAAAFFDHHGILALWEAGRSHRTLSIRHARPVVCTMLDVLEVPATDISIETEP